jgi:hypothetical protein
LRLARAKWQAEPNHPAKASMKAKFENVIAHQGEKKVRTMKNRNYTAAFGSAVLTLLLLPSFAIRAHSQATGGAYPHMAPLDEYLMADQNAEIALAKSSAPKSISDNAEVMVLDRQGYKTVVRGTNGFVCIVERGWTAGIDDPGFWNPKIRGPVCFNPPAARSYLPITIARTRLVLAEKSKTEIFDAIESALDKKELPAIEVGAMCYMLSKDGYLGDGVGHWHPHLMFFVPYTDAKIWGADLPGSPIFSGEEIPDRLTVFFVPVRKWSDGTEDADKH